MENTLRVETPENVILNVIFCKRLVQTYLIHLLGTVTSKLRPFVYLLVC